MQDTIDELFDLLVDLTAADKQHTFETHEHDIDLASLLIPLLKSLDETVQKYQLAHEEHSPWQINVLNALVGRGPELPIANLNKQFIQFTSGISRVSRHTNVSIFDIPGVDFCLYYLGVAVCRGATETLICDGVTGRKCLLVKKLAPV